MKAQDTSELFFEEVVLPKENILGNTGQGFSQLMEELPQERLSIAVTAISAAEAALNWTIAYVKERTAFEKKIIEFQNTKFTLAKIKNIAISKNSKLIFRLLQAFIYYCGAVELEGLFILFLCLSFRSP